MCSVTQSGLTLCNPMDCSPPGSLSMEFSRQEKWNGQPSLLQGIFPTQGSSLCPLRLLHQQAGTLPLSHLGAKKLCESHFSLQISCPNLMSFPSSLSTYHTRLCHNFCSLKHNSKTSTNFFFLLSTISWRIVLTIDFSNLSI